MAQFYHPQLRQRINGLRCCGCQQFKLTGPGYGELPEREPGHVPWDKVTVNLIGQWKIELNGVKHEFNAITCIDTVSLLVKLICVDNKTSDHVRRKFKNIWLSHYPWPNRWAHDNGGEFVGESFQRLLATTGIHNAPTTSRKPQANAICKRMHQMVGNILRTLLHLSPPQNTEQAGALVDDVLATAMHAMRATVSQALGTSPSGIIFHRDMFLDLPLMGDLQLIRDKQQVLINENLHRQNARRQRWDYAVGERVWVKTVNPSKLAPRTTGPF